MNSRGPRRTGDNETQTVELSDSGEIVRMGSYEIVRRLGRGGMGVVYEATREPGSSYALKIIESRFLAIAGTRARHRFSHEIKALAALDHPGVLRMVDAGLAQHPHGYETAFFVTERLFGHSLDTELNRKKRIAIDEALRITSAVADALEYLDEHGVEHRDVKPGNVFLEDDGRIVLIDFGLAKTEDATRLTGVGTVLGTSPFISPERWLALESGSPSDVFSLGVILFLMLTGSVPFDVSDSSVALRAIQRGIEWSSELKVRASHPVVTDLIDAMVAYDPTKRPSAREIQQIILSHRDRDPRRMPTEPIWVGASDPATPQSLARLSVPPSNVFSRTQVVATALVTFVFGLGVGMLLIARGVLTSPDKTEERMRLGVEVESPHAPRAEAATPRGSGERSPEPDRSTAPSAGPELPEFADANEAFAHGDRADQEGRAADAIVAFERAIELNPAMASAHRHLGDVYRRVGNKTKAGEHYLAYLGLKPLAPDASEVRRLVSETER